MFSPYKLRVESITVTDSPINTCVTVYLPSLCSVHSDLTLDGFKRIFYMEYAHRMWGRLTGLVIMLPAVYFWARGRLGPALKPRVGVYIGLVVAQVKSMSII